MGPAWWLILIIPGLGIVWVQDTLGPCKCPSSNIMRIFLKVNKQGNKYIVLCSSIQGEHEHFLSSIYGIYPIMPEGSEKLLLCSYSEDKCTFQGTLQLKCQASGIHVLKWVVLASYSDLFLEKTVSEDSLLPPHPHSCFSMFYNAHKTQTSHLFSKSNNFITQGREKEVNLLYISWVDKRPEADTGWEN